MLGALATAPLGFAVSATRVKFDSMLASVTLSPKAIEFIDSDKQRLLFKGVLAARAEEPIETAFAIVYEDLGPVRVAGDLIAKQLSKVAASANERAAASGDVAALGILAASRSLFKLVDIDSSGSLDRAELLRSPQLLALIREETDEDDQAAVERFMLAADVDNDGEISFVEFANAAASEPRLQMADEAGDAEAQEVAALASARSFFDLLDSDASGSVDRAELLRSPQLLALIRETGEDDQAAVERFMLAADADNDGEISFVEFANAAASEPRLQMADEALEAALQAAGDSPARPGRFGRKSPEERFDHMLEECARWESELGCTPNECEVTEQDLEEEGEDRMLQVLKGSFVGARCQPVADALRVCYLEYSPLRFGGDLIFKLLKRVVASQLKTK
tara:strand:+ start:285 stop:1469 length:1185 start_codon:yes stop_codon:yes gene_type:complete